MTKYRYRYNAIAQKIESQLTFVGGTGMWWFHKHKVSLTDIMISGVLADIIDDVNEYLIKLPFKSWSVRHRDYPHNDLFMSMRSFKKGRSKLIICFKDKAEAAAFKMTVL